MATGTFLFYCKNVDQLNLDDLAGAAIKLALVDAGYTPDDNSATGHETWADVSDNEIANGQGYVTGGLALTALTVTAVTRGFKFSTATPQWTASGTGIPAHRYYVMYVVGTLWGLTNPLIGYFIGDSAPADIPLTSAGNTLTVTVPAGGWFDVKNP